MALDNLPAFPDDMYDTAHDGAVPQPVTPRKPISPFSFTKHLTRTPVPVAVVPALHAAASRWRRDCSSIG